MGCSSNLAHSYTVALCTWSASANCSAVSKAACPLPLMPHPPDLFAHYLPESVKHRVKWGFRFLAHCSSQSGVKSAHCSLVYRHAFISVTGDRKSGSLMAILCR